MGSESGVMRGATASATTPAVAQALLVTFLWSTSWVLIKFGLADLPPITFAGLRYGLASLLLLPLALRPASRAALRALDFAAWRQVVLLGIVMYALTQGAQFLALSLLPAVTVSLVLQFSTVAVAFLGVALLGESLAARQWAGIALFLAGVGLYFLPAGLPGGQWLGLLVAVVGVLANAVAAVLGRAVNRAGRLPPGTVTAVSMGVGSVILLAVGLASGGPPHLSLINWLVVLWLAVVNTAFAFTLWNRTLRSLSAVQSSIINSTMLVQIALLAWIFLGERPGPVELVGLLVTAAGVLVVQWGPRPRPAR